MFSLLRIFMTGMLISFLGTLPPGSLNVSAMQLAVQENVRNALRFALGVALVEVLYVWVSLQAMAWVETHRAVFRILEWVTVLLFVALALGSFINAGKKAGEKKSLLPGSRLNRFWLGFSMSAVNPVQIPFWFIWSTYLVSTGVLATTGTAYNSYTVGIGMGTLAGLGVFIFGGRWVIRKMKAGHRAMNVVVGMVFLVSGVVQLYRLLRG